MNVQPGARLGPYEIVESIGAGGMGEVYRARDPRIGRDVAIKVLPSAVGTDRERLRRFEQEARAAGALNHPNLLTIHDIGHQEGAPYIVTELLEGETLRDRLGDDAPGPGSSETSKLSPRRVIDWGVQIANGLAAAHEAGIVHRDLKPENIFVTRDGRVKILDFGLAKLQGSFELSEEDATVQRGTDPGMVMGTIAYMSPEQVRGQSLDHRSDIFSLGLVLYELASGRRAFERETKPEIMTAILKEDPPDLKVLSPAAPPALVRIIDHCLEKHPEQRFQSARDLAFHLNEISESSGRSQIAPGQSGAGRSRWLIPAAAVAVALLIGFATGRVSAPEPDSSAPTSSATELRMLTFSGRDTTPAISPDGKLMAFSSDRNGTPRIWIKQLNGGGEISLTDGPDTLPRFSPDGTALLFIRGGSNALPAIYKVPLLGGAPRKLIDDAFAADWSPDGETIVFLRSEPGDDLMRSLVMTSSADGSGQKEIARIEGKNMTFPRWSPDGTQISMVDNSYGNYANKPLILNRDGSEQKWIDVPVEANLKPALMWVDDERLLLGTIPGATNVVTGSGSVILTYHLKTDATRPLLYVPYPLTTVDLTTEGRIIFDTTPVRENLRYIELADDRSRWLTRGTSIDRQPAFSPDGTEVIFSSNMSGNLDLWIVSTRDGSLRRLTDDQADDFDPVFSHDGQSVFWSSRRVTGHYEIWAANVDGSGARQVSHDGFDAENPTPTSDGEWIVYNSYDTEKKGLWKIRPDGTEATHLVKAESQLPEVSPDGQYASFHLISTNEVRVVRLSDGKVFNLGKLNLPFNPTVNLGRSRWKPDSNIVVFLDGGSDGRTGLWEQPFIPGQDTRAQRRTFTGFDYEQLTESFGFSPDGRQLIISGVDQLNSIMISDPIPELAPNRP